MADISDYQEALVEAEKDRDEAIALLRAWVAGCGDEHFSTKEQCRTLLERSGEFLSGYPFNA